MPKLPQDPYHLVSAALDFHAQLRHGDTLLMIAIVLTATPQRMPREVDPATVPAAVTVPHPCAWAGFRYMVDFGVSR